LLQAVKREKLLHKVKRAESMTNTDKPGTVLLLLEEAGSEAVPEAVESETIATGS
jgi:hypothetical protein